MTYRRIWAVCWGGLVALGVCWAAVVLPAMGGIIVVAVGGVFVALACAAVESTPQGQQRVWPSVRSWRRVAWGGPACLALVGVLSTSPVSALLLLVGAGLSSPPVVVRVRTSIGRSAGAPADPPVAPSADLSGGPAATPPSRPGARGLPHGLVRLPDAVLARLWTESYWALREARSTQDRLLIVELRCRVLDELHRRNPTATARWLDAGAHPKDCPVQFRRNGSRPRRTRRPDGEESAP